MVKLVLRGTVPPGRLAVVHVSESCTLSAVVEVIMGQPPQEGVAETATSWREHYLRQRRLSAQPAQAAGMQLEAVGIMVGVVVVAAAVAAALRQRLVRAVRQVPTKQTRR